MNALRISAASALLAFACTAQAGTFVDFEAPTYTAGQSINGFDGWVAFGGNGRVTPDVNSGYVPPAYPILSGSQSYVHYTTGGLGHGWGSATGSVSNAFTTSLLVRTEFDASSGYYAVYFSDNIGPGSTPGGFEMNHATDKIDIFGTTGTVSNGLSFAAATTYKMEMEVNLASNNFSVYATDLTNSGPRLLAGTGVFYSGPLSLANVQANGGLLLWRGGGSSAFVDDLAVNPIPEPATLSLLSIGAMFAGRRRRV
jgi:hypothetical protein